MKHVSKLVTGAVAAFMIGMTIMPGLAAGSRAEVVLSSGGYWATGYSDAHDTRYSAIQARCEAVYPVSGYDSITKIHYSADVLDGSSWVNVTTEPYEVLYEGKESVTMYVRDGYLDSKYVWFKFSNTGRIPNGINTRAVVWYDGSPYM